MPCFVLLDAYGTALAKSGTPFSRPHVLTGLFYLLESIRPPKIRTTNNSSSGTSWSIASCNTQKFHSLIYFESSILISQNVHNYHMLAKHMFLLSLCFYCHSFVILIPITWFHSHGSFVLLPKLRKFMVLFFSTALKLLTIMTFKLKLAKLFQLCKVS